MLVRVAGVYRRASHWTRVLPSLLLETGEAESASAPAPPARAAAGVFCVTNRVEGRVYLGRGAGVEGRVSRQRAQLELGVHPCAALQADWRRLGPDAFTFEVLERLPAGGADAAARLREAEARWRERLRPWGEGGYHPAPRA